MSFVAQHKLQVRRRKEGRRCVQIVRELCRIQLVRCSIRRQNIVGAEKISPSAAQLRLAAKAMPLVQCADTSQEHLGVVSDATWHCTGPTEIFVLDFRDNVNHAGWVPTTRRWAPHWQWQTVDTVALIQILLTALARHQILA